jgi:cyclopropane-fatty-acyl-phospholipid synthase
MSLAEALAETGALPDAWIRAAIRSRLAARLARPARASASAPSGAVLRQDISAEFFEPWLGPRMKYSCGLWPTPATTLAESEDAMLALTCERAGLEDGMDVLDLGAGWGALSLWIAGRHPASRVVSLSDSEAEVAFIRARAAARGLANLTARHADARTFGTGHRFDRVVAIEMLEHVREREAILARIAGWLEPGGRLFAQAIVRREPACANAPGEAGAWMAQEFFPGGLVPREDLLPSLDHDLQCVGLWSLRGLEYARTIEAWLERLTAGRPDAIAALAAAPGPARGDRSRATRRWRRWRVFLIACSELFAWRSGDAWGVTHYLFAPRAAAGGTRRDALPGAYPDRAAPV